MVFQHKRETMVVNERVTSFAQGHQRKDTLINSVHVLIINRLAAKCGQAPPLSFESLGARSSVDGKLQGDRQQAKWRKGKMECTNRKGQGLRKARKAFLCGTPPPPKPPPPLISESSTESHAFNRIIQQLIGVPVG